VLPPAEPNVIRIQQRGHPIRYPHRVAVAVELMTDVQAQTRQAQQEISCILTPNRFQRIKSKQLLPCFPCTFSLRSRHRGSRWSPPLLKWPRSQPPFVFVQGKPGQLILAGSHWRSVWRVAGLPPGTVCLWSSPQR